jgi:TolB-like protein/Tfp pilus assembly protein PilF
VTRRPGLDDIAFDVLDGTPVDWSIVDANADETDRALIDQLRTLAAVRLAVRSGEPPADSEPARWGHLRLLERIGHGAFGEVYRAWDTRLDREVALKLLPPSSAADSSLSSVIDEGRLLARIQHPNVVTIYGAERIDGRVGLWMELVKGRTLEQALRERTTFPRSEVLRIGVDLCRAVAAVHAAGLLHRDIKTQNVMLTEEGRLVLMDFGAGREVEGASDARLTGTPLYLAPEVLAGGAVTVASDLYSIGVVLYHLLTGSYPVEGRDLADLRRAHATRRAASLPGAGRIPQRLCRVLARALDPDPGRRYASADAFGTALSTLERAPAARRRAFAYTAAVAVVVAAVLWGLRASLRPQGLWGASAAAVAPVSAPVIAVMPFTNLSSEPDSDYFVDGLTTEVIRNLSLIDGLQVRSRTSSFLFQDRPRDLAEISEKLQANLIVEADVLRVGNRLRINAQLIDIATDVPLWSQQFDRTVDDVFAIQDEISVAIVNELRLTLGRGQRRYQTSLAAYETYLRGRMFVGRRGTQSAQQAARLFEQVIATDPGFAPAHAGLADAYAEMSWQLSGLSNQQGLEGMRPAAMRALEIDPLLAEAHAAMGIVYARERDWANAAKSFERAIELNPTLTQVQTNYSQTTLLPTGQLEKAQQLLETALTRDPLSPMVHWDLAWAQFCAGRFDEAIANFQLVLAGDPGFPFANQGLARALTFAGKPEDAIAVWNRKPASDGDWERWLAPAYIRAGRRADMERLIDAHRSEHPYRQALIYAALGDKDRTFEALNGAVDLAPHRTAQMLVYPEMALLGGDARLDALRTRLNLP